MNPFKHKSACSIRSVCALHGQRMSSSARPFRLFSRWIVVAALWLPMHGMAADAHVIHTVVPGDTLISLATRYLDDPDAWTVIRDANNVQNPRRLMPGSELLIRLPAREVAVIFAHGDVTVLADGDSAPRNVTIGQKLAEGSKIRVGENSYLSLQFADGSITRVMSNSVVQLARVREQAKSVNRVIKLQHGAVDVSVTPQSEETKRRKKDANTFEIMTPGAIAAVRGTRYDVTVSDTQDTTSSVTEGTVGISSRTPTQSASDPVALTAGSGMPIDASGQLGTVRPLLPAPDLAQLQADVGNPLSVVLSWPEVGGAATYQLRVGLDADMRQVQRNRILPVPTAQLTGLTGGTYHIGVRAMDEDGILGQEGRQTIEIKTSPAFPFLAQPAAAQTVEADVTFDCTPVAGASGYHLQVSRDAEFASNVIDQADLPTCHFTASGLENGTYFWRVAAVATGTDGSTTAGPFGNPASFTVDPEAASAPDDATTVYWMGEPGNSYIAQISRDEQFSEIVRTQQVTQNTVDLYGLPAGKYYLRLQAGGEDQSPAFLSAARMFEVQPEERVIQRTWADTVK